MHKNGILFALLLVGVGCGGSAPEATEPNEVAANDAVTSVEGSDAPTKVEAPAADAAPSMDAAVVGANVYKVAFENDSVRILNVNAKPGDKVPFHSHPDHVAYALSDGTFKMGLPDGTVKDIDFKKGQVMYLPAMTHSMENTGAADAQAFLVELKVPAGTAAPKGKDPAKAGPRIYKANFENERVRVFDVTFKKGAKIGMHTHPDHAVYVVSGGTLVVTGEDKKEQEFKLEAGQAVFLPAQAHSAKNAGDTEIKLVVVEIKPAPAAAAPAATEAAPSAKKKAAAEPKKVEP